MVTLPQLDPFVFPLRVFFALSHSLLGIKAEKRHDDTQQLNNELFQMMNYMGFTVLYVTNKASNEQCTSGYNSAMKYCVF